MVLICKPTGRGDWNTIVVKVPASLKVPIQNDLFERQKKRKPLTFDFFGRTLRVVEVRP